MKKSIGFTLLIMVILSMFFFTETFAEENSSKLVSDKLGSFFKRFTPLSATNKDNPESFTGNVAPVIGNDPSVVNLTLSEYIDEYNAILRGTVSSTVNTNVSDSDYIACAKTLINKMLKNPSSAQYNSANVYEKDNYGRAIVYLDVSAQNSFGGWVRSSYYVCIQSYKSDGTFTYSSSVPFVEEKSNYDILVMMNDFGEDPADEELESLLFEYNDFVRTGDSIIISPVQTLECYELSFDYGIQNIYIDASTNKVISVKTTFKNTSVNFDNCEKICVASAAALTNTSMSSAKVNVGNVINFSNFTPTDNSTFYYEGFVYDYRAGISVTFANKDSYEEGIYWTPNNGEEYYEKLADKYSANKDFDNAIIFYEQVQIKGEKINAAYYGKAEQSLDAGNFDEAGLYFNLAGNYKDSAVRVLEVFYTAGQQHEKNNDYNSAIYSYSMAGDYSDAKAKCKECNFKQGEINMSDKKYLEAATCFEGAADYNGASEKCKEACYLYAEQQLLTGSTDTATTYFKKAGDYKDAATRMRKYYYDKGTEHLASKEYLEAADAFKQIMDYSDASTKYKEANYLYGEKMLEQGNIESAKTYFYNASGYSDADTRVQRYYYEAGEVLLKSGEHLSAVDKYSLAGNYSDASTKILECYYQYGSKQLSLNYITEATTYLSWCRGYKDTDDILLGYYYGEATKAVKILMDAFPAKTFTATVDNAYKDAKNKLVLCEGYKDSATLLTIVEKLYYVWTEMQFESNGEASLYEMTASYSGDVITIAKSNFMPGTSCTLSMAHNVKNNTFSADITHMFNLSAREHDVRKVVSAMLVLFTDIENTTDFDTKFSNKSNWTISGDNESFTMSYGGYNISVQTRPEAYGYIDCSISVTKTINDSVAEVKPSKTKAENNVGNDNDSIAEYMGSYSISVSSYRTGNNPSVDGSRIVDGDLMTAWNSYDQIYGEWLQISTANAKKYQIAGFRIASGYWKNSDVFKNNAKPREIEVYCNNQYVGSFELENSREYQTFWFDETVTCSEIKLVITDGYDGKKYSDCCITEIELLGPDAQKLNSQALPDWGTAVQKTADAVLGGKKLEKGDLGIEVVGLQLLLRDGFGVLSGKVDGEFGSSTRDAVKELASEMIEKLPECEKMKSGVVDAAYWRNMLAYMDLI